MHAPEWIVENGHVLNEYIGTLEGFKKSGFGIYLDVLHRHILVVEFTEFFVCGGPGLEFQGPQAPRLLGLAVERPLASQGDVGLLVRVHQG